MRGTAIGKVLGRGGEFVNKRSEVVHYNRYQYNPEILKLVLYLPMFSILF